MKSKNVKIPLELIEIIESLELDESPGEVLLEIVKDYMHLREYARTLKDDQNPGKTNISEFIIDYYSDQDKRIEQIQKSQNEITRMLGGLEIFFTKFKR